MLEGEKVRKREELFFFFVSANRGKTTLFVFFVFFLHDVGLKLVTMVTCKWLSKREYHEKVGDAQIIFAIIISILIFFFECGKKK